MSLETSTAKEVKVARKPTPMGFTAKEKQIEDVSIARSGTNTSFLTPKGDPSSTFAASEKPLPSIYEVPHQGSTRKRSKGASLDEVFPRYKRYCFGRLSRKQFFILIAVLSTLILAIIIGLAVGLSHRASKSQNLPLPSNKQSFTGDLTYFDPALGACGVTSSGADDMVAVSYLVFDAAQSGPNPNANPLCGRKIRASVFNEMAGEQRSVDLTVLDRCTGCKATDIDTTRSVFDQLAGDEGLGRLVNGVTWAWLDN